MSDGNSEPTIAPILPGRPRWLRMTVAVLCFIWWIIKVIDWFFQSRGLNRVEFPKYETPDR
jgi:hypothetical protein